MVSGDPATLMISLCEGLKGYNCPGDWVDTLKERDIEKEKANRYTWRITLRFIQQANSTVEVFCRPV